MIFAVRLLTLATLLVASVVHAQDHKALLAHIDGDVRVAAADQLALAGAKDAVPELTECLVDEWWTVRVAALRALSRARAAAKPALPAIRRCLDDTNADVQTEAFIALVRLGHIEEVVGAIGRDRKILDKFVGEHDDVLRMLLAAKSWHVRYWVVSLWPVRRGAGPEWTESLARLAASDPAQAVRYMATIALRNSKSPDAWPHLIARLDDTDSRVRQIALRFVAERGGLDEGTRARVIEFLIDPDPLAREWAAYALRGHAPSRAKLEGLLDDKNERVRLVALASLAQNGDWPTKGADLLVDEALKGPGLKPAFPFEGEYRRNLRAGGSDVSTDALARKALLSAGAKAIPDLVRAFQDPQQVRRIEIVYVLGRLKAADALLVALKDKSLAVRLRAAATRAFLGETDAATLALLVEQISVPSIHESAIHTDSYEIDWSSTASTLVERVGKPALPALEKHLENFTGNGEHIQALIERIKRG